MTTAQRFVLAARPRGVPTPSDFRLETIALPDPGPDEVLIRNLLISVDPGMRARLNETRSYADPIALGGTIEGATVGEVLASNNERLGVGDLVVTGLGWQDHAVCHGRLARKVPPIGLPPSAAIGVLGIPGMTAYFGLYDVGGLTTGQTVVITSAAGAVGSAAGQIARIEGARAIGLAGGPDKCRWLTDELGFDAAIDYKAEPDLRGAIRHLAPDGIDIYFDNVGNAMVDLMVPMMNTRGRIVISGQVADYNLPPEERPGIRHTAEFITERLRMEGLVVFDYAKQFPQAMQRMATWIHEGKLRYREEIIDGFDALPEAFCGLFRGENFGRRLVRAAPDPA